MHSVGVDSILLEYQCSIRDAWIGSTWAIYRVIKELLFKLVSPPCSSFKTHVIIYVCNFERQLQAGASKFA